MDKSFLILGVFSIIALFETVSTKDQCESCKNAAKALQESGEITRTSCFEVVSREDADICWTLVTSTQIITLNERTPLDICEALDLCGPSRTDINPEPVNVAEGIGRIVTHLAVSFISWVTATTANIASPASVLISGRKKRDLFSASGNMAEIYGVENDEMKKVDPTVNPTDDTPDPIIAARKPSILKVMCELCRLKNSPDFSDQIVDGDDWDKHLMGMCHSLPQNFIDQRECIPILRSWPQHQAEICPNC
ncbi:uncharacterized protein LOC121432009 [Lytechinus variegatus]|uniref:uncharacterized protein LOC121432009 n=1 Tax=Lytechinus variegatus TaxID=7654 RepID=UPI001BB11B6D|nr:uncharacterized protein LOC121432009 [Lytechinus variegatus]